MFELSVWFTEMEIIVINLFLETVVCPPHGGFASTVNEIRHQLVKNDRELNLADQRCPFSSEMRRVIADEVAEWSRRASQPRLGGPPGNTPL